MGIFGSQNGAFLGKHLGISKNYLIINFDKEQFFYNRFRVSFQ